MVFDLAELHPLPADLDLGILPPDEDQRAIWVVSHQVA
jgi:hypothetical protein